jgi:hypothetical protein
MSSVGLIVTYPNRLALKYMDQRLAHSRPWKAGLFIDENPLVAPSLDWAIIVRILIFRLGCRDYEETQSPAPLYRQLGAQLDRSQDQCLAG